MFKAFSRIVLFLLILSVSGILFLVAFSKSGIDTADRYNTEAKAHSVLIGRFLEHLVNERAERLRIASSITDVNLRKRSLHEYSSYIKEHYDIQGGFAVGELDKNFRPLTGVNNFSVDCDARELITGSIKQLLSTGKSYVNTASLICGTKKDVIMLLFPVMDEEGFSGIVYDIFTVNDSELNNSLWLNTISGGQIFIVSENNLKDITNPRVKHLFENRTNARNGINEYQGRIIGYFPFSCEGTNFILIYQTESFYSLFSFPCCPELEKYIPFLFATPVVLLLLFAALELIRINRKLEHQIKDRTAHYKLLKERYESLFQTIPEYVVLYLPDGTVLETNRKCYELVSEGQLSNIFSIFRDRERFRAKTEILRSGVVENMGEFIIFKSGGVSVNVSVSSAIVSTEHGRAVLSALTDLTEYKGMQASFFSAQRQEAVGTLAAGMAHDFSNILQNISLQYSLAERSQDSEKRSRHLMRINGIVEGARKYLEGVLKYTKSSAYISEVKTGSEITRMAIDISAHILPGDVKIEYRDESDGMSIKVNESRYIQVIVNLCQNASDAMDEKGVIFVETTAEEKQFGNFFCLKIKDTGKGIEHDELKNIFKPFYTSKENKGTGLGLATVKQVVMDSGGMIDIKTAPGEGCEFIIMIPESK